MSWVLPSCDGQSNAVQSSYRIKIYADAAPRVLIYDSGTVAGKSKVIFVLWRGKFECGNGSDGSGGGGGGGGIHVRCVGMCARRV